MMESGEMENIFPMAVILANPHGTVNGKYVSFALFGKSCGQSASGFTKDLKG
jgi:hypothetical protein